MKILLSRKDDILKKKSEWEEALTKRQEESKEYQKFRNSLLRKLENTIKEKIGTTTLDLNISAKYEDVIRNDKYHGESLVVYVTNEKFKHKSSMNWKFIVTLNPNGRLIKNTYSSFIIDVTSQKNVDELQESVRILEILSKFNWDDLLILDDPGYSKFVVTELPEFEDWDSQLEEIDSQEQSKE